MKLQSSIALIALLLFCSIVTSRSILRPDENTHDIGAEVTVDAPKFVDLEKRRGGGGGGGRGGGSSGGRSSGGKSGSSGGGSGGRSGGGGKPSSPGSRPSSNVGGSSRAGSGASRSYAGGRTYAGGAAVPYTAGKRSPLGVLPFFLPLAALAFFPGLWLYGAYAYDAAHYAWHNATSNLNQSLPITCLCQEYSVCGCEKNDNSTYIDSLIKEKQPNGLPANTSDIVVANVNGTTQIFVNGTLPNGTTAPDPSIQEDGASSMLLRFSGYWVMASFVVAAVALL